MLSIKNRYKSLKNKLLGDRPLLGDKKGMTLIEIIIVITILGSLMTMLFSNLSDKADQAKVDQTRIQLGNIAQSLQLYRVHNNKYPTTSQGLNALLENPGNKRWRGPYIEASKLNDAWDAPIEYESDGRQFKMRSGGTKGLGTDTEIVYPEEDSSGAEGAQ